MRLLSAIRAGVLGATALVTACVQQPNAPSGTQRSPVTVAERSASDQRAGDENHKKIIAQYGGVYDNPRLTNYVKRLGRELVSVSEQPGERWTFTVLDSSTINAFALPGGYVYVTRGLVALANSEAELAGVIGHEIGHVTAGHSALRQERATIATGAMLGALILGGVLGADPETMRGIGQLGQVVGGGILASYSRDDELAADNLGIRYLARAGYDPYAQADFLESMGAAAQVEARAAGRAYNPNQTDFFASHPATGPRTRQAIEVARRSGEAIPVGANRNRESFLRVVDGITFGENPDQGFVDGTTFSHPKLGFTYQAPQGFRLNNQPTAVIGVGPRNTRFILDSGRNTGGSLGAYITGEWIPQIAREYRVGSPTEPAPRRINGLQAASATVPVQVNNRVYDALLVAVRMDNRLYRLTGLAPRGSGMIPTMSRAAETFRRLTRAEKANLSGRRIDVVTVRRGDTVARLAQRMRTDTLAEERFRALNGLGPSEDVQAGQKVKLIR